MKFALGDRLKVGDDICTVKFVGRIPKWPNTAAYGVEWDNPSRGKNCGSFDGKSYFETSSSNSGSFFIKNKLEEIASGGLSFNEAFSHKFESSFERLDETRLETGIIDAPTFKRIEDTYWRRIPSGNLILDHYAVNDLPLSESQLETIRNKCADVSHLDLSYNLLSNFQRTCVILAQFRNLRSIDLSRNVFSNGWDVLDDFTFPEVKNLIMTNNKLSVLELRKVIRCFPNLEVLDVSWNQLPQLQTVSFPSTLKSLGLNGNFMTYIPTSVSRISLKTLNLSNNLLSEVNTISSPVLRHLDLSFNEISDWKTLDMLNDRIPQLRSLRINDNPISANEKQDFALYQILARFGGIEVLDDSILSKQERDDAELFFVSKVAKNEIHYDKSLTRWKTLSEKFSLKTQRTAKVENWLTSSIVTVRALDEDGRNAIEFTVLTNFTVRHLKTIVCRKLGLNIFDYQLHTAITNEVIQTMTPEFRPIDYYGVSDNSTIYLSRKHAD